MSDLSALLASLNKNSSNGATNANQQATNSSQKPGNSSLASLLGNTSAPPANQPPSQGSLASLLGGAAPAPAFSAPAASNPPSSEQSGSLANLLGMVKPAPSAPAQPSTPAGNSLSSLLGAQPPSKPENENSNKETGSLASLLGAKPAANQQAPQPAKNPPQNPPQNPTPAKNESTSLSSLLGNQAQPAATPKIVSKVSKVTNMERVSGEIELPVMKPIEAFPENAPVVKFDPTKKLQSVIDNLHGATILEIPAGTYTVELSILKMVWLRGVGDVKLTSEGHADVVLLSSPCAVLENLTIEQIETREGGAVTVGGGCTAIKNCRIRSVTISGVQAIGDARLSLEKCVIDKSYNPSLMCTDRAQVSVVDTKFLESQTYGVLAQDNVILSIEGGEISKNQASGLQASGTASVHLHGAKITANLSAGVELQTTGQVLIEKCDISDHPENPAMIVQGTSDVVVKGCTFNNNDLGSVKCFDGASLRSIGNRFCKSEKNVMAIVHQNGTMKSDGDTFFGNCIAAVAAFANGTFNASDITIQDVSNAGVLVYDHGILTLNGGNITRSTSSAFQFREGATVDIQNVTVTKTDGIGVLVTSGVKGKFGNCRFVGENKIATEISGVTDIVFDCCEFSENLMAGANVHGENTTPKFTNCKFIHDGQIGTDISDHAAPVFENCLFEKCAEAGVNATKTSSPEFRRCKIYDNGKIGLSLEGTSAKIDECKIKLNGQAGISCFGEDHSTFTKCKFHKNRAFAGQIHQMGTAPTFNDCSFKKHSSSVTLIVIDHSEVLATNCTFEDSLQPHFEIRDSAVVTLKKCAVGTTEKGTGVQVHAGGTLVMEESSIKDNTKLGMVVADEGMVKMTKSTISGCGMCGIMTTGTAKLAMDGCVLDGNGQFAMQLNGGEISFTNCTIKNHQNLGVVIGPQARVDYADNTFENNGQKDIYLNNQ